VAGSARYTAILDANVLYSQLVRDLLLSLAACGLYHARWSADINAEWTSSIYSKWMLDSFGIEGAIRVSPLHCNSPADIDRFLEITLQISEAFAQTTAA
jgi:cysteine desulfurase/selenocysteine lyase